MKLPEWLESNLPEPRPVEYIYYRDGAFCFRNWPYATFAEAYDAVPNDANMDLDQSVKDKMGWSDDDLFFTEEGNNRLFIAFTDQEHREMVEENFASSLDAIYEWRENRGDFKASYYMLDGHPAFWTRHDTEPTFDWTNWGNVSEKFWFAPATEGMMMETGAHIAPNYTDRYHDLRLDTYGKSFEDCIVQTAALVDKFFHEDGTARGGVEYEKSELELLLEERMQAYKESKESE